MRIVAVIAVKEATDYLHNCLTYLQANDIKVLLIDHGLAAPGRRIVESARFSDTIMAVEELPVSDTFSLVDQLRKKERMISRCECDWVIHQDIDELLQSSRPGDTLREAIIRADRTGVNAINFVEMVFVPLESPYTTTSDGWPETLTYYYFAPKPNRLMRARKKAAGLSMLSRFAGAEGEGGHRVFGDGLVLYEENLFLRHYVMTDQEHARRKYVERRFCDREVSRGWHANRIGFAPQDFNFPDVSSLKRLPHRHSASFDLSEPHETHYWQWRSRTGASC